LATENNCVFSFVCSVLVTYIDGYDSVAIFDFAQDISKNINMSEDELWDLLVKHKLHLKQDERIYDLLNDLQKWGKMFNLTEEACKKIDEIFNAFKKAGYEIVKYKKICRKTKKTAEQKLDKGKMFISAGNYYMDKMIRNNKCTYIRDEM